MEKQLDEADAAFDQPPSDQAAAAEIARLGIVHAVEFFGRFGFLAQIERLLAAVCIRAASS